MKLLAKQTGVVVLQTNCCIATTRQYGSMPSSRSVNILLSCVLHFCETYFLQFLLVRVVSHVFKSVVVPETLLFGNVSEYRRLQQRWPLAAASTPRVVLKSR